MSTFQAIVYGIIHGFAEFVPISANAHDQLVPYLLGWPAPTGVMTGALAFGAMLSLFLYFRHHWASIISCFIQVLIFRKRPMTLDERLPIFMALTSAPAGIVWYYFHDQLIQATWSPLVVAGLTAGLALPLTSAESWSRKNKGMFDWTWLDALLLGIAQIAAFVPGCGRMTALLPAALLRGFNREAAAKYAFFASMPFLIASAGYWLRDLDFHAAQPMAGTSWLSFSMAVVVTTLTGLLAIGGFMKHIQSKGFGQYAFYRVLLATVVAGIWWLRRDA
jgi:undecaprenyl-diphosphatase